MVYKCVVYKGVVYKCVDIASEVLRSTPQFVHTYCNAAPMSLALGRGAGVFQMARGP